ncbi:MAG: peptide-binding protein, partial [Leptolyngbya foveolarum]
MITCPNCNHQNPDGANQCEACYTPLPNLVACPSCGNEIQANASFCGQCGADLRAEANAPASPQPGSAAETPLAATVSSFPETGASSNLDSTIKTQNFLNLDGPEPPANPAGDPAVASATPNQPPDFDLPDLVEPDPLLIPDPMGNNEPETPQPEAPPTSEPAPAVQPP